MKKTKEVYNEPLIDRLNKAKEAAGVSYEVMGILLNEKKSITYKYLTKQRNLIRSNTERRAVVAESILLALVANGKLPVEQSNDQPRTEQISEIIDDYLECHYSTNSDRGWITDSATAGRIASALVEQKKSH